MVVLQMSVVKDFSRSPIVILKSWFIGQQLLVIVFKLAQLQCL